MLTRKCDICGAEMRMTTPRYKVTFDGWLYTEEKDICTDCFKRIADEIKQADTPQTELTAKCLNCHNAKACKENHWDGCIYEPQTDIYPLTIVEDRYTGVYSNGEYTAWNMYFDEIPQDIDGDDVSCYDFWHSYNGIVGLGRTPNEAIEDLRQKLEGKE